MNEKKQKVQLRKEEVILEGSIRIDNNHLSQDCLCSSCCMQVIPLETRDVQCRNICCYMFIARVINEDKE